MPNERDPEFEELLIIDFPGGCPLVVDPQKPHLGGNMRGGDLSTNYSTSLWPWILRTFNPGSIMDVGCGEGHALRWFQSQGKRVLGVEGLHQNAKRCGVPTVVHDLTQGPILVEGIDLVWCCDVVEHIEAKYLQNILDTLRQAPVCVLEHGTQEHEIAGWHHVNNQGDEYWIDAMASVGMMYDEGATKEARKITSNGRFPTNGKIFRQQE